MKKKALKNWFSALFVAIVGAALSYVLLIAKPEPVAAPIPEPAPPLVRFVTAEPQHLSLPVLTQGSVQAEREVSLTSQVSGRVIDVDPAFVAGGFFSAEQPLLQIETADYTLAIAKAESQVAAMQQALAEEEGRSLQAKREWRDLGTQKANALFLREPQLVAAKAALKAAQADLENAHLNLARTQLRLPFNGRVVSKSVDVGQFVAAGTAVARAYATDRVQVRLPITDRQLARLSLPLGRPGDGPIDGPNVVLSTVFAGERWEWNAVIARTEANMDVDSRVIYAVAIVEEPFGDAGNEGRPPLTPGLFVEALIDGRSIENLSRLPRSALKADNSVFVIDRESQLTRKSVQAVHSNGRNVWLAGLEKGERVVVSEGSLLVAGMSVSPQPAQQLARGSF